jgi:hypothetical protein
MHHSSTAIFGLALTLERRVPSADLTYLPTGYIVGNARRTIVQESDRGTPFGGEDYVVWIVCSNYRHDTRSIQDYLGHPAYGALHGELSPKPFRDFFRD